MINQQALKALQRQSQLLQQHWQVEQAPEMAWQWLISSLLTRLQPTGQLSSPGVQKVQLQGLPETIWLELPAEWQAHQRFQLYLAAGSNRYLGFKVELAGQRLSLSLQWLYPAPVEIQALFESLSKEISRGLRQHTQLYSAPPPDPQRLPLPDNSPETRQLTAQVEAWLAHWGQLTPSQFWSAFPVELPVLFELLQFWCLHKALKACWFKRLPAEVRSQQATSITFETLNRWQVNDSLSPSELCLSFLVPGMSARGPLLLNPAQSLLLPGQRLEWHLTSSRHLKIPALNCQTQLELHPQHSQPEHVELSSRLAPRLKVGPKCVLRHSQSFPVSIAELAATPEDNLSLYFAHQISWPFLIPFWPESTRSEISGTCLLVTAPEGDLPAALIQSLQKDCLSRCGALFESSPQGMLLLLPPLPAGLAFISRIWQLQHALQQVGNKPLRLQLVLHAGRLQIHRAQERFRIQGPVLRQLNELLKQASADACLLSPQVVLQPGVQRWIYQEGWQFYQLGEPTKPFYQVVQPLKQRA